MERTPDSWEPHDATVARLRRQGLIVRRAHTVYVTAPGDERPILLVSYAVDLPKGEETA